MPRQTLDFGIDLGTTNSAIAVMEGAEPAIIKNNQGQEITPSAVGFTKTGVLRVGDGARRLQLGSPHNAYTEFKRRMGSDHLYDFAGTGRRLTPEDLSAEMLKALKADVEQSRGEVVEAAVITVPAAFELHQCDATRRAAQLAGFSSSPLVQEPVAAALAYGFQREEEKAYWLVYDFGGGTFDAALIRAEEGIIQVVAHEGDNFLGGSDIDWAIVQELLIPRLSGEFDLPDFRRNSGRWAVAMQKLKNAVEKAKIEASRSLRAPLIECCFEDASGNEVDLETLGLELTQEDVCRVASPLISRSANLVRKVLGSKGLSPAALHKVVLVGGPTQAPYFREQLRAELGAPVDFSLDPMTVVASGAAIFAGTQPVKSRAVASAKAGEFLLDLKSKSVGIEPDPLVGGRVQGEGVSGFEGFKVEFINAGSGWTSGQVPVHGDGTFAVVLSAEPRVRNQFRILLRNAAGQLQKTAPENLHYTIGAAVEEQPIIHSLGVGLSNNQTRTFFAKGEGLPRKKTQKFTTTKTVKPGQQDSAIRVPVVEGESEFSDRNRLIGFLDIQGTSLRRELPGGQEVEVTLRMDESRRIQVEVYIPYLDEEFTKELETGRTAASNDPGGLRERLIREEMRFSKLKDQADRCEEREASKALGQIQQENVMEEIRRKLDEAQGDFVTGEQCDRLILDLACRLDAVEARIQWPDLVKDVREWIRYLGDLVEESATEEQASELEELHEQAEEQIRLKDSEKLIRIRQQLRQLNRALVWDRPSAWARHFFSLESKRSQMSDRTRAESLITYGHQALQEKNFLALRDACCQLSALLPPQAEEGAARGWNAGIF
ncbi:MAG TPA: Hsp70 family protein [Prosthecobacter sp.]